MTAVSVVEVHGRQKILQVRAQKGGELTNIMQNDSKLMYLYVS